MSTTTTADHDLFTQRVSTRRYLSAYLMAAALTSLLASSVLFGAEPLRLVQTIAIPNVSGRLDHMAIDLHGRRLFVAAIEHNTVEVLDVRDGRWLRSLPDFSKPQGLFYVEGLDRLFVANGKDGTCRMLDGKTFALIHSEQLSLGADLVDYDRRARLLYVGHGGKDAGNDYYGELALIDVMTGTRSAQLRVGAHPGAILVGPGTQVFITVPDKSQVLVLDRATQTVAYTWIVAGAPHVTSLAIDERGQRLFVGTRNPSLIVVLDASSGREVARTPTVGTLDGLFFDSATRRTYASGGEGFVDVQQQVDPDHYVPLARIATGANARTSLFVPELNRLFVAVPKSGDQSAAVLVYEP